MEAREYANIYKVALLVAVSCALQILESFIPHPIPGLRLGLANMITLISLVMLGFRYALEIAVFRTILSSFIMGTFMSPTFILSFLGSVASTLIMGFLYWLSGLHNRYRLSIIGISIAGAFSHNIIQIYLAYLLLVKHKGIFIFLPWLSIGSVVTGWITGIIAATVCSKLKGFNPPGVSYEIVEQDLPVHFLRHYLPGRSFLHKAPAEVKIACIFLISLVVLIFNNLWLYFALFSCFSFAAMFSGVSFDFLFASAKRYVFIVITAFLLPLFFNSGRHILYNTAYFNITSEGLNTAVFFALRVILLVFLSILLVRTTSPQKLTSGLANVLSPLRIIGIRQERVAAILSISWGAVPGFLETAKKSISFEKLKRPDSMRKLTQFLSDFIAGVFIKADNDFEVLRTEEEWFFHAKERLKERMLK